MAKKKTTSSAKTAAKKAAGGTKKTSSGKKPATRKSTAKKTPTKKAAAAKTAKKATAKTSSKKSTPSKTTKRSAVKKSVAKNTRSKKATSADTKPIKPTESTDQSPVEPSKPKLALATKGMRPIIRKKMTRSPFTPPPAEPSVLDRDDPTMEELRKVKTGLSKKDIEYFHKLLMEKRSELLGDVASLEFDSRNESGNLSNMPLHMADVGSDNYEQEFTLGLVESERKLLREIDEALIRIKDGIFGVCMKTAEPINRPRLEAKPWAKYSIEVVRELEKLGKT